MGKKKKASTADLLGRVDKKKAESDDDWENDVAALRIEEAAAVAAVTGACCVG